MEKKTTGNFLSTLRKAKGMTQRELAELLNVSDKAVSRWERDESMPDILLIPVLADIFEVSCDDLLRGEKTYKENYEEALEKRMQRMMALVKKSKSKFQAFSMISIGLVLLGWILAIVLNFSFHKATIGFFCALTGIIAGGMTQAAFYFYFKGDVDTDELECAEFITYKKYIRDHTLHILYLQIIILCICLPLLFMGQVSYADYIAALTEKMAPDGFKPDTSVTTDAVYPMGTVAVGLQLKTWMLYGGISGVVGAIVASIINYIIRVQDVKKGRFGVSEDDLKKDKKNVLHLLKYILALAILLGATFAGSKVFEAKMPDILAKGTQFDTFEEFKQHMETIPDDMYPGIVELRQQLDKYKGTIYGDNGEVLCEYRIYNDSVTDIKFGDNNKLPITVYSEDDDQIAKQKTEDMMWIWYTTMGIETLALLVVYVINKRRKIKIQS